MDKAQDLQEKFASDMQRVIDTIPVVGHIKGGVHYALGEPEKGEHALKAASRSTGVVLGGVGGLLVGNLLIILKLDRKWSNTFFALNFTCRRTCWSSCR